jgi:hypothetical protein
MRVFIIETDQSFERWMERSIIRIRWFPAVSHLEIVTSESRQTYRLCDIKKIVIEPEDENVESCLGRGFQGSNIIDGIKAMVCPSKLVESIVTDAKAAEKIIDRVYKRGETMTCYALKYIPTGEYMRLVAQLEGTPPSYIKYYLDAYNDTYPIWTTPNASHADKVRKDECDGYVAMGPRNGYDSDRIEVVKLTIEVSKP